jgi:hypothetical protein
MSIYPRMELLSQDQPRKERVCQTKMVVCGVSTTMKVLRELVWNVTLGEWNELWVV